MPTKIGYKSSVGYIDQATLTVGIAPTGFVEYNSEGFKKEISEKLIDAINGTQHYKKRVTMEKNVTGSLSFPMVPGSALRFIKNGIGDQLSQTVTGAATAYTFKAGITSFTTMSFEVCRDTADTGSVYRYVGCGINSIKLAANVGDVLKCDIDVMGYDEVLTGSITTASYRTYTPFTFIHGTVSVGTGTATPTGTTTLPVVESFALTVANNLQQTRGLGSANIKDMIPGMQDVTMELGIIFTDNELYNRFLNGTPSYVSALFDTGVTIGTTALTHKMRIEAFNCYFNGTTPNIGGASEILKGTFPVRSIFSDASSTTLQVTIVTDVATFTTS